MPIQGRQLTVSSGSQSSIALRNKCLVWGLMLTVTVIVTFRPQHFSDSLIDFGVATTGKGVNEPLLRGLQPLRCEEYLDNIYDGTLNISDPNQLKIYSRRIHGFPGNPFWISVHEQEFDQVRWETIFLLGKFYESAVDAAFVEILQQSSPDARVIDVGGNIGWFTLLSRSMGFSVETFEPLKQNSARLCESLRLNHWSNDMEKTHDAAWRYVNVHDVALGKTETIQQFNFHPVNPGEGSLHDIVGLDMRWKDENAKRSDIVTVATLDSFARGRGWFDDPIEIAVLKVDIEGYEPNVFAGAKQLLASHMIKNILLEMSPNKPLQNEIPNIEMLTMMFDAGYILHKCGYYMGPKNPNPFPDASSSRILAENLVDKTMKNNVQQMNLWLKVV